MEAVRKIWSKPGSWLLLLFYLIWFAISLLHDGIDLRRNALLSLMLIFMAASLYVGNCVARPARSYLAVALGSLALAAILITTATNADALLFWFALTMLGLAWAWYWERTEPLPSKH